MKILILYASAGAGHQKAGEAVYQALKKIGEDAGQRRQLELLNALKFTPFLFRLCYPRIYLLAISYLPLVWGAFYYLLDNRRLRPLVSVFRRIFNRLNSGLLIKYLHEQSPDIVICTHFFAAEVICWMKRKYGFKTKLIVVITDLWPHHFWVLPEVDDYLVGLGLTRQELIKRDICEKTITVTGIPISPVFNASCDRSSIRERLGLNREMFTVLVVSGGFGVGPIERIARYVDAIKSRLQMIIICGHNRLLFKRLKQIHFVHKVEVLGFVNNMHELMEASDVAISKAGGLTVSEALAKSLPLVVIQPIPGQETKNCQILESYDCAVRTKSVFGVKRVVEKLIASPERLAQMRQNAFKLSQPNAAYRVVEFICQKYLKSI